jgi:hypothetical protein
VGRGHVEKTKATTDELAEIGAVTKGGNNRRLWEGFGGVEDAEGRAEHQDEAVDNDCLGLESPKQLVARQPRRGVTEAGGEALNRRESRNRPRTAPRRGR